MSWSYRARHRAPTGEGRVTATDPSHPISDEALEVLLDLRRQPADAVWDYSSTTSN